LKQAAVLCEIVNADGRMARLPDLREFSRLHQLKMCTIEDLIKYRRQRERLVHRELVLKLPTAHGEFDLIAYTSVVDPELHVALCMGGVGVEAGGCVPVQEEPVLVRIHSQCLTGDVFDSLLCDCGSQLHHAMAQVALAGKGAVLYMRQEGRGIGLANKIKAYALQDQGFDTVEANLQLGFKEDLRDYGIGAQILRDLGVGEARLLTNNPHKIESLQSYGVRVSRVSLEVTPHLGNIDYLRTKKEKLGHLFSKLKVIT